MTWRNKGKTSSNDPTSQPQYNEVAQQSSVPAFIENEQSPATIAVPVQSVQEGEIQKGFVEDPQVSVRPVTMVENEEVKPVAQQPVSSSVASEPVFQKNNIPMPNLINMEYFLTKAYQDNPEVNAARAQLKAADESLPEAYTTMLPNVSYNLSNAYVKSGFQNSSTKDSFYTNGKSLDVRQELFNGGETFFGIEAALKKREAAEQQLKFVEQRFFQQAIEAYVNTIFSGKIYNLAQKNEKTLEEQLNSTRQRYVVGDATKTDVAQSEARYASAKSNAIQAYNEMMTSKSNFRKIFQAEAPRNLEIPSNLPKLPSSVDEAYKIAFKNNPELLKASSEKEQRDNEVEQAKSQLYPQVSVVGSMAERESVTGTNLFAVDQDSVTLNVSIPIYDSGVTYSRVRQAQDRNRQAGFAYSAQKNILKDDVEKAWQDVEFTTQNIEYSKASLAAAEFAVQGIKEEQKEGARLIQDILDAERERFQAEINYARAIRDSILSVYTLKSVTGQLTASELNLPVANYDTKEHFNNTKYKVLGF